MADTHRGQIKIWGRSNSVNVQKVLWCLSELDLAHERIDAGMAFGRNHDPDYLAMNPNGRIPTLVDESFVLWESNSIMRYLVLAYGKGVSLYPEPPKVRAAVDRWLDWTLSTLQPVDRPVFWALVRTPSSIVIWRRSKKTPTKRPSSGASSTINSRRVGSSRATISRSPISPWVPMRGGGSALRGSESRNFRTWIAGTRSLANGPGSSSSSRRPMS